MEYAKDVPRLPFRAQFQIRKQNPGGGGKRNYRRGVMEDERFTETTQIS